MNKLKTIKSFLKEKKVYCAVAGIIADDDRILSTKRSDEMLVEKGKWCLPGGVIKRWEKAKEALRREIKEEIGFSVKKIRFLFYHDEFVKRLNLHSMVLVFSVEVSGKEKPNWEVSKTEWFDRREISKLDLAYSHRDILNKFFKMMR